MFRLNIVPVILFTAVVFLLGSCKSELDESKHLEIAKEMVSAMNAFNQSYKSVFEQLYLNGELIDGNFTQGTEPNCVSTEIIPDSSQFFPAYLRIDFQNDCQIENNVYEGGVDLRVDGFLNQSESTIDFSFEEFSLNHSNLEANYSIQNKGKNDQNLTVVEIQIRDGKFKNLSDGQSSYSASIFSTHLVGHQTAMEELGIEALEDDIWEHNFSGTFVSSTGGVFNIQSETNLTDRWQCAIPTAGRIIITGEELQTDIIVDFGNGRCDELMNLELDGDQIEFTID